MHSGEAIIEILKDIKRSQRSLAQELGITPQTLSNRLIGEGSMQVDTLADMASVLGYKVVLVQEESDVQGFEIDS